MQAPAQVLAYFTEAEGLSDLTPQIEISTIASQEPMRGGLADVYAATLADGTKVAVKSLRAKTNGDNKELKVCLYVTSFTGLEGQHPLYN